MAFWSGERLKKELPTLIREYDEEKIDCASYTLTLGPEAYVTSEESIRGGPKDGLKILLGENGCVKIPPGQFAFLLTEEFVRIPSYALGFISIKTSYKFRGLVNVSGFHVDPGWDGRIVFGVYNAGPVPVHLKRGMMLFLMWFADLDADSKMIYAGNHQGRSSIEEDLINNLGGQVFSPTALATELKSLSEKTAKLNEQLVKLTSNQDFYQKLLWVLLSLGAFLVLRPYLARLFE